MKWKFSYSMHFFKKEKKLNSSYHREMGNLKTGRGHCSGVKFRFTDSDEHVR